MATAGSQDTVFALATAAASAALAIVRISGPEAIAAAAALAALDSAGWRHGQLRRVRLRDGAGATLDQAMAVVFRAPRSATGEDVAELHLHGSVAVVEAVSAALRARGLRPAHPGEFSRRAVLHGKLSLLEAEAVADLIGARAEAARHAAVAALDGQLSRAIEALRVPAVAALAEIEARLDFALDDDLDSIDRPRHAEDARAWAARCRALAGTADAGRIRLHGARVVLHGAPNAGKSTLLNALIGADRALVDAAPGTTRDLVEARVVWEGCEVVLVDTAGVRDGAEAVEAAGIARALEALHAADVVVWLRDAAGAGRSAPAPDVAVPVLRLWTRADRADARPAPSDTDLVVRQDQPASVDAVRRAVLAHARARGGGHDLVVLRLRHADALARAADAGEAAASALLEGLPLELAAADLRDAIAALDELIGPVQAEDVLDEVFARFCIGK